MAYESVYEKLGEQILKGEKIDKITLKGKEYRFHYSPEEFVEVARKSGWDDAYTILGRTYTLEELAQRYKPTQADFICDFKSDYCLNSGGFGCIDGDTKITTPGGEIPIRDLYENRIAPFVYTKNGNRVERAVATVPVKYPKAQLYTVVYGGKAVTATAKHRFLTRKGWVQLSDLSVGEQLLGYEPSPQESILDNARSVLLSDVFHLFRKALDFLFGYRHGSHSNGAPLRWGEAADQDVLPSPIGVLEHNPPNYSVDARFFLGERNRVYQRFSQTSKNNSFHPWRNLLAFAEGDYTLAKVFERAFALIQLPLLFLWNTVSYLCKVLIMMCSNLWSFVFVRADSYPPSYHTITSITPTKVDHYYDIHVFGTHNYLAEGVFHHNSGKSIATYIKLILTCKCFPGNRVLLGRKTLSDIDRAVLPELFDLMPPSWYEHRVKDGLINFTNGSQIILFGLDAMQSGGIADIKKAQQKLKSLNLGGYFIDQLEEVEYEVFEVLNSRLRRTDVPFRQGNMNSNPANFWAYHQFKKQQMWTGEGWADNPHSTSKLYETSMLYNPHLPGDYIRRQLSMGEDYVRRFVLGEWTTDVLLKGTVFAKEHIRLLETMQRAPMTIEEGCEIYEPPRDGMEYRMGVDPSEGITDPSSISVVSFEGKKVAKFNGKVPITALADKVKFLYYKYRKPLIVPESNAAGAALIREIRDLNVYRRKQLDYKHDKETERLGFRTTWDSKSQLINHFQSLLRRQIPKIYDHNTIEEMKSFMWTNEAAHQGAAAAKGFHDDDIMSTLLAYWEFNPERVIEVKAAQAMPRARKRFQYT